MWVWYTTPTSLGKDLYGKQYQSAASLAAIHNETADPICDHMHDGLGFLTNHVALL